MVFYLLLLILLFIRLYLFYSTPKIYQDGDEVNFSTQVLTDPMIYGSYQTLYVNIDPFNKVLLRIPLFPEIYYGDKILVSGKLKKLLLNSKRSIFTIIYPRLESDFREKSLPLAMIFSVRQKIIQNFKSNLDPVSSSLLLGIVFGIKDNLSKDFAKQIQITGVTHVIAASGMNVTIVSGFIFYFFTMLFKRQIAILLSIFAIIIYTALAGFQASIIRAAIMGIIVFSSQILGRAQYGLLTLLITAFIMLFIFPQFLIDTGFQLSFSATFGLLYIPQILKRFQNDFTEVFITTISAQIATLPILITNFGNYSIFSIITNALVLWTVPILMILGSFAAIFGLIFSPFAKAFLLLCLPFLLYFEKIVSFFASFGSTFNFSNIPWQFSAAYYFLFLSFLAVKFRKR